MVSHAEVMNMLRRNADYNDMVGSTNGAGYIGGCGCCGGGYIGGAYIGGCSMCMGGARKKRVVRRVAPKKHCVKPLLTKSGKYRCKKWAEGPKPKKPQYASMAALYKYLHAKAKPKKRVVRKVAKRKSTLPISFQKQILEKTLKAIAKASKVYPESQLLMEPPLKLARRPRPYMPRKPPQGYRKCLPNMLLTNKKTGRKYCKEYEKLKPYVASDRQAKAQSRFLILTRLYSEARKRGLDVTRKEFYAQYKNTPTEDLVRGQKNLGHIVSEEIYLPEKVNALVPHQAKITEFQRVHEIPEYHEEMPEIPLDVSGLGYGYGYDYY